MLQKNRTPQKAPCLMFDPKNWPLLLLLVLVYLHSCPPPLPLHDLMSGPIRQVIGPIRARMEAILGDLAGLMQYI